MPTGVVRKLTKPRKSSIVNRTPQRRLAAGVFGLMPCCISNANGFIQTPLRSSGTCHRRHGRRRRRTLRHDQEPGGTALIHAESESHIEYSSITFRRRRRGTWEYVKELAVNA